MTKAGILVLADGTVFEGKSQGQDGMMCGEVVFNTAQTGYQEILTDPSYTEQIIVFTHPHIGNVGINKFDMESDRAWTSGIVLRDLNVTASNWRAEKSLQAFLIEQNIIALTDIDTRALTHHLSLHGSQPGCLMTGDIDVEKALSAANEFSSLTGKDLVPKVSTHKQYTWNKGSWNGSKEESIFSDKQLTHHVVVYDFGVKQSILRQLVDEGCKVTVVPGNTSAQDILKLKPDGIVLSNGPGDPSACTYAIDAIRELLKQHIPIMGICLGHQLLALASGATIDKMKFGHHGANHPVQCLKTGTVFVSSQNHGFVVSEKNIPSCLRVTHRSLFDGTTAGIKRIDVPAFGFQGHPEAGPGPSELKSLFNQFTATFKVYHAKTK